MSAARLAACFALGVFGSLAPRQARADGAGGTYVVRPSIHQRQLAYWKAREAAGWESWVDPVTPLLPPRISRTGALTREVHGYHPYWMGSAYTSYEWPLLSTVAWFALELDGAGQITDDHGWPWTTLVSTAHANGVRVIVTAALFDADAIDLLLGSSANRANAVSNLVAEVLAAGADGVNVDFEGVPGSRKADLVTFLGELRAALGGALPLPYLTISTPAVDWNDAFDYEELATRCDHLMIMAYDYHWSGSSTTGPVSPLGGWGPYNVPWTVNDYRTWGATPDEMLLGVPYYGYEWGAVSGEAGAPTTSTGVALTYSQAKPRADLHGPRRDGPSSTAWYRYQSPDWFQGWFDDGPSLAAKYSLAAIEDLAGVGIWALGYDGSLPELWEELAAAFDSGTGTPRTGARLTHAGANPFRDHAGLRWELARPSAIRLSVHDVAGRRVRSLVDGVRGTSGIVTWDGRDADGRPVSAGVYFARLETADASRSLPVVRLR